MDERSTPGRAGPGPVVELHRVSRCYAGGVSALREVSLSVQSGELVAIVGPSGSGKSTLLNLVGTLDRPSTGRVRVAGHELATLSDRAISALRARTVGFVFQQFHLPPGATAVDAVAEGLLYAGVPRAQRLAAAVQALDRVGLGHRLRHRTRELSGGERQRTAIARAVAGAPELLLADEPTGNLDSGSGAEVLALLRLLNATGTTVLVITHDRSIAASLPRLVELRDGRVIRDSGRGPAEATC